MEEKQAENKSWLSRMAAKLIKGTKEIFEDKELKRWQEKGKWQGVGEDLVTAYRPFQERAQKIAQEGGSLTDKEYKDLINHIQNHPLQNEYKVKVTYDTSKGEGLRVAYRDSAGAVRDIYIHANSDRAKELGITREDANQIFYLRPAKDGGITKITEAEKEKEIQEEIVKETVKETLKEIPKEIPKEIQNEIQKEIENEIREQKIKAQPAVKVEDYFKRNGRAFKEGTQVKGTIKFAGLKQVMVHISDINRPDHKVTRVLLDEQYAQKLGITEQNKSGFAGKTVTFTVGPKGKVSANITTAENKSTVSQVKSKGRSGI